MPYFNEVRGALFCTALLGSLSLGGCQPELPADPESVTLVAMSPAMRTCAPSGLTPDQGEGEIFGSIYLDEERDCDAGQEITLTQAGSLSPYNSTLQASSDYDLMWEFWDTAASDGPCRGSRDAETPHAPAPSPTNKEEHCVTRGAYTFVGPSRGGGSSSRTIPLDYLGIAGSVSDTSRGEVGRNGYVAGFDGESPATVPWDLVVNTDLGSTTYSDTAVLHVDASTSPNSAVFGHMPSISVDTSFVFRFAAYRSNTDWIPNDSEMAERGRYLARLYYRVGPGSWHAMTRYYDPNPEGGGIIRKYRLPGPSSCPGASITYTVGLEVLRPDEDPANTPETSDSAQRQVTVTCPAATPNLMPPTSLSSSSVGTSTARVGWTNGSSSTGVTTRLEVQHETAGWDWITSSIGAGVTYYDLSSLDAGTSYDVRVRHDSGGISSAWLTTTDLFTTGVPAPTSISASSVTATSATISWTNGLDTPGTTTDVEYKPTGGSWTAGASGLAAGATSTGLTGLSANTSYSVRVRHNRSGVSSSWTESVALFTTEDDPPPPTITFSRGTCDRYYSSSKWRIKQRLDWTGATGSWQVREASTNDTTAGSVIGSGSSGSSMWTGEYLEYSGPLYSYFWVKVGASPWVPLAENALETTSCEA